MNVEAIFYVDSFGGGGIERNRVRLANAFSQRGLRVEMVVHKDYGPFRSRLDPSVQVSSIGRAGRLTTLWRLTVVLRHLRPEVLISAAPERNLIALLAARLSGTGTRVVLSEHNHYSIALRKARPRSYRLLRWLARRLYPRAAAIIAISQGVGDDLAVELKLPREQVHVVYNPVISEEFEKHASDAPAHPWLHDKSAPVILAVGRLRRAKGFDLLLEAFAPVHASLGARLIILGEGEERNALTAQADALGIGAAVSLPGFVENPHAFMARADLFVLSSRYEGLGNVLIEAMACACPVISTDCPSGPREILKDGALGRLVPTENVAALRCAIAEALVDPGPIEAAKDFAMGFTISAATRRYIELAGLDSDI